MVEQKPLVAARVISGPAAIEYHASREAPQAQSAVGGKRHWVSDLARLLYALAAVVTAVSHLLSAIGG